MLKVNMYNIDDIKILLSFPYNFSSFISLIATTISVILFSIYNLYVAFLSSNIIDFFIYIIFDLFIFYLYYSQGIKSAKIYFKTIKKHLTIIKNLQKELKISFFYPNLYLYSSLILYLIGLSILLLNINPLESNYQLIVFVYMILSYPFNTFYGFLFYRLKILKLFTKYELPRREICFKILGELLDIFKKDNNYIIKNFLFFIKNPLKKSLLKWFKKNEELDDSFILLVKSINLEKFLEYLIVLSILSDDILNSFIEFLKDVSSYTKFSILLNKVSKNHLKYFISSKKLKLKLPEEVDISLILGIISSIAGILSFLYQILGLFLVIPEIIIILKLIAFIIYIIAFNYLLEFIITSIFGDYTFRILVNDIASVFQIILINYKKPIQNVKSD